MRRFLPILTAAAAILAAAAPHAQTGQTRTAPPADMSAVTLDGGGTVNVVNVPISLVKSVGTTVPLGRTDPVGWRAYDPAALAGKPRIDIVVNVCPNQTDSVRVDLVVTGVPDPTPTGCTQRRTKDAAAWGGAITVDIKWVATGAASGNESSFITSPPGLAIIGGGVVAGVLLATHGSSSTGTGGGTTGGETRSFATAVPGSWQLTLTVTSNAGSCFAPVTASTLVIGGTATATTAQLAEPSGQTVSSTGATTQSPTNDQFIVTTTGTGVISGVTPPTTFVFTLSLSVGLNANTSSGSITLESGSCTLVQGFTGVK